MDKDTFVREIEACSGMLYRVAWTILHNDADCADAMQDAALKAWEKCDTLHETQYFRTWITRILINTCYDMLKKSRRLIRLDEIPEPAMTMPDPELAIALGALPDKLRLPLVLCYVEGLSYREAANVLRTTEASIRGRLHRGKQLLRKELMRDE